MNPARSWPRRSRAASPGAPGRAAPPPAHRPRAAGYDRVMLYRFLPDESGSVVAETVASGFARFLGLRYPASDIPKQARALYLTNWLRIVTDIDGAPSPLQPTLNPMT